MSLVKYSLEIYFMKIRKAVFSVAGVDALFLPATETMPKELFSIIDKPLIQYSAEEAFAADIDTLIFATGRNKRAIEDHFDANIELDPCCMPKAKMYRLTWFAT